MRRFLYFFPGLPGINPKMLTERGLIDRFTGHGGELVEHVVTGMSEGPAGSGCMLAPGSQPPEYRPGQRWIQGPQCWVGIEALPPGPDELARDIGISGYEIEMAGQAWRVPLIRRWDPETLQHVPNLPTSITPVLQDGKYRYVRNVSPAYEAIDALAERTFTAFATEQTLPIETLFEDATALLSVNYRIGIEEAGLLGLLDEQTALRILALSIDLVKLQKQAAEFATDGLQPTEIVIEDEE